jgi:putative Holliday junction resolvase
MRILGLDLGERRIGVALSDLSAWLATPLTVLHCSNRDAEILAIEDLVRKHQVDRVVVGFPRSLDGTTGPQAQRVERYVLHLRERLQVPVVLWDERLSTAQAERMIHETGRRVQRERIDAVAAAVILQSFLDAQSLLGETEADLDTDPTLRQSPAQEPRAQRSSR